MKRNVMDKSLWLVCFLLFISVFMEVKAQGGNRVSGTVTDVSGVPLIGVNVSEKGTLVGNITDVNGTYAMTVSGRTAVLRITAA